MLMKKPKFFNRSVYSLYRTALSILSLSLGSVLSRPLPHPPKGYYTKNQDVIKNQDSMERYNDERYNSLLQAINSLSSYIKNNFLTDKIKDLNVTNGIIQSTLEGAKELSAQLDYSKNITEALNDQSFLNTIGNLNKNITALTSSVYAIGSSHQNQLSILQNLIYSFQQNATHALDSFQNNATYIFDYFLNKTNEMKTHFDEKKSQDNSSYGMQVTQTALLTAMSGMLLYNLYKINNVNKRLDDIEIGGNQLQEQSV